MAVKESFLIKMKDSKFHQKHEDLTQIIYDTPMMLPSRYVYVLTNRCNLRCDFCFQDKKYREDTMTTNDWINLTKQLPEYSRVTMTGGEPLMFDGFDETFSYVAKRFNCNVITNGLLLTPEKIDSLLSYPNFKVLSLSIDDIGNTIRGVLPSHWNHLEKMMKYFGEKKQAIDSYCFLDAKTMILDKNADNLFEIYRYLIEKIGIDTHTFQFLKGSSIQHSDKMFGLGEVQKESQAHAYVKFEKIKEQLEKVRQYNTKNKLVSFLHPKIASLNSKEPLFDIDYVNEKRHWKENYSDCKFVWSSVHVNFNGKLFPCLAIEMGDVREKSLGEIIKGNEFENFKELIRRKGTVEACNRCGWLRPKEK